MLPGQVIAAAPDSITGRSGTRSSRRGSAAAAEARKPIAAPTKSASWPTTAGAAAASTGLRIVSRS
jgi:hypothetical protein